MNRFTFSLRTLFLAIVVSTLCFSSWLASRRLDAVASQLWNEQRTNAQLRHELGHMEIEDSECLCGAARRDLEDLRWQWRLYVPRKNFKLGVITSEVPKEGLPTAKAEEVIPLELGENLIRAEIRCNRHDEWEVIVRVEGIASPPQTYTFPLREPFVGLVRNEGLFNQETWSSGSARRGDPMVLVRLHCNQEYWVSTNRSRLSKAETPCNGVLIWAFE